MATIIEELRQSVQLERRMIARLKTANIRFSDAQVERIWAIVSAHQTGLSIRKIAGATGLSSSRIAVDLDTLSLVPNDPHTDKESNHRDPRARHRRELAEPPPKPKKLTKSPRAADRVASSAGTTATVRVPTRLV